jgi:hypothetical protein
MMASPYGYPCPVPPAGQPLVMPQHPQAYAAPQLAAQPKPEPAPKAEWKTEPKAESNPEPKPELKEPPSLPLNESVEVED